MSDNIGLRIKKLRQEKQMSVEELAKKIGKSRATVYRYENNEIENLPYTILVPIAKALDTTPAILMGYDDSTNKEKDTPKIPNIDIKELRHQKGLSLVEMAKEFNVDVKELKAYEEGLKKIPFDFLKKLADYFDIDMSMNIGLNYTKDINEGTFGASMRVLEITKRWNDEVGETSFSNDEITKLIEYAKFLISQRK